MPQKIEKPWVVYRYGLPSGIGMVVSEGENSVSIKYDENHYQEPWKPEHVRRFSTSQEAIDHFLSIVSSDSRERLIKRLELDFPEALKQEREQSQPSHAGEREMTNTEKIMSILARKGEWGNW